MKFIRSNVELSTAASVRVVDLVLDPHARDMDKVRAIAPAISAVIYDKKLLPIAKLYWQHTGDGISSRRAEFCHALFKQGLLVDQASLGQDTQNAQNMIKGPRRYQRMDKAKKTSQNGPAATDPPSPPENDHELSESCQFLEERYGRNLDVSFINDARSAIRQRLAGSLTGEEEDAKHGIVQDTQNLRGVANLTEQDVYLYSCGMNAIFETHRMMLAARGPLKSISFGFPYVDTLKILQKFGPGCLFYGHGSSADLDDLEARLKAGERYLALFCEFPGNPILHCPDLRRIRQLADTYDFAIVVDETISNLINVHLLPFADVVVSSLTKIFSGECNVMGGSAILNPRSKYHKALKQEAETTYEDNYWPEDVIFMERNSRHYIPRIHKINENAEIICSILQSHPCVKTIFYPKHNPYSKANYDACRTANGGYGGLLSVVFHSKEQAIAFYDHLGTAKGPSLGTNFTLASPYVILAHYNELDWAARFGVPDDLIRISVGLEDEAELRNTFAIALKAVEAVAVVTK